MHSAATEVIEQLSNDGPYLRVTKAAIHNLALSAFDMDRYVERLDQQGPHHHEAAGRRCGRFSFDHIWNARTFSDPMRRFQQRNIKTECVFLVVWEVLRVK